MDRLEYTSAVSTVRVYEKRLLDSLKIDRMVDAKNADEVLRILNETEYSKSMAGINSPLDFEKILERELERVYKDAYKLTKDREIVDILAIKRDYLNLKILLKAKAIGEDKSNLLSKFGTIDSSLLKNQFENASFKDLNPIFIDAYKEASEDFEKNKDPRRIDIIVDKAYFKHLKAMANDLKIEIIDNYVKYKIDSYNILSLLRSKKQELDLKFFKDLASFGGEIPLEELYSIYNDSYENIFNKLKKYKVGEALAAGEEAFIKKGKLSEVEKKLEDEMLEKVKPAKKVTFGPEPLFGYLLAKEVEQRVLRMIMVSKINSISPERIRERLSGLYV